MAFKFDTWQRGHARQVEGGSLRGDVELEGRVLEEVLAVIDVQVDVGRVVDGGEVQRPVVGTGEGAGVAVHYKLKKTHTRVNILSKRLSVFV